MDLVAILTNLLPLTGAIIIILVAVAVLLAFLAYVFRRLGFTKLGPAEAIPEEPLEPPKEKVDRPNMLAITKIIELTVQKAMLPYSGKDESRSIVRDAATRTIALLRKITREVVCKHLGGCLTNEPEELRDYRLISESAEQHMVAEIMKAVERNHFYKQTSAEWRQTKESVFLLAWGVIESYYEERYYSERVPVALLREANTKHHQEFWEIYEPCMERCYDISVRIKQEQDALEQQCIELTKEHLQEGLC